MTGFFAVVHFDSHPVERAALEAMARRIAYRGRDHHALIVSNDGRAGFGAAVTRRTRESAGETQPLTQNDVTALALAYLEDRAALIGRLRSVGGAAGGGLGDPASIPDVELILRAYLAWGADCARYIFGDFAFFIWDAQARRALFARDRLGIRALFYAHMQHPDYGRALLVSTELMALRLYPTVSDALDMQAIGDYLASGSHLGHDKTATAYRDIRAVPLSETLIADADGLKTQTYWTIPTITQPLRYAKPADYVEHYKSLLFTVVRDRLRSDETLISLSGGMDSSSIAAAAVALVRRGEADTTVRAISTAGDPQVTESNEEEFARIVADHLGIELEILQQRSTRRPDSPFLSVVPGQVLVGDGVYHTAKFYAERAHTSLLGDGADELFTPTPLWHVLRSMPFSDALALYRWMWGFLGRRPALEGSHFFRPAPPKEIPPQSPADAPEYPPWIQPDFERRYDLWARWLHNRTWEPQIPGMLQPRVYKKLSQLIWTEDEEFLYPIDYTPAVYVAPFLDLRMIEFALSLPPTYMNRKKYLMRQAMKGVLPDSIVERPKTSPGPLLTNLLKQPGLDWVDKWEPVPALAAFVDRAKVPAVVGADAPGNPYAYVHLRALALNQWLAHYQAALAPAGA